MENYEALLATIALMMGASWASGINLYAVLLVLGWGGSTGHIDLPAELSVLEDPLVIAAAGVMYFIEFLWIRYQVWIPCGIPYKPLFVFRLVPCWQRVQLAT